VTAPALETFREYAKDRRVIPVTRRLLADAETPIGVYGKLAAEREGTFLLESAENGGVWSRYSFIGVRSSATLTERNGEAVWTGNPPVGLPQTGDPLKALRETLEILHTPRLPDLPPLTGGMVGFLGYDAVRRLERLPDTTTDELTVLFATDLAALDHETGEIWLIANAVNWDDSDERVDEAYADAVRRLDAMERDLARPTPSYVVHADRQAQPDPHRQRSSAEYRQAVEDAKEEIRAGEAFQIVVSQRFELQSSASALDIYRVLRRSNPSPYMYLVRLDGFDIVGSSPEALVKVTENKVILHPIAGTRRRGATPEEDHALEEELRADVKERAEHLMLVDLGRNDVGKVCAPGTVEVVDFMDVRRYSHVMHLESTVTGQLKAGMTAFDALTAAFPAGTLSGAPKPRAMEIIDKLEVTRRGVYGGVVGYLDVRRTAAEDAECRTKAAAVLNAIAVAGTFSDVLADG
jgi:anthranilate synthase component 1